MSCPHMSDLGKPISIHTMRHGRNVVALLMSITLTTGIWWGLGAMHPKSPGLATLIAIAFTLITVGLATSLYFDRGRRITVHERGVAWNQWGKYHEVGFDEIAGVRELSINGRKVALLLRRHTGDELTLRSNVTDRESLLASLVSNASPKIPVARVVR